MHDESSWLNIFLGIPFVTENNTEAVLIFLPSVYVSLSADGLL